jgi:hypothetical protein
MESELKELLQDRADEARIEPTIPAGVVRRARGRRRSNLALAALVSAAVVAGSVVGIRAVLDVDPPDRPGAVGGWPGIWPQDTRAEAEETQAEVLETITDAPPSCLPSENVDPGGLQPQCPTALWQLWAQEVATSYATDGLGWPTASATVDIEPDTAGPITVSLESCRVAFPTRVCRPQFRATVTLERLLRPDRFGLWFVTDADQTIRAQAAEKLVREFLNARRNGGPVAHLISGSAAEIYEKGEAGLSLYGGEDGSFVDSELVDRDPAGEDTLLFLVRLHRAGGNIVESLLVGPGANSAGDPAPVVILSVSRVEFQEIQDADEP